MHCLTKVAEYHRNRWPTIRRNIYNIFEDGLKQAVMQFPNGYGVSVLSGNGSLSDNNHPYEIAVIMFDRCGTFAVVYPYFCNDDVLSFKTEEDVSFYMQLIQRLHPEGY